MRQKNYIDESVILNTNGQNAKAGSNGIWESILNGAGSVLSGVAGIIGSAKGTHPDTNIYYTNPDNNMTGTYIAVGGGLLLVVIVLIMVFRK